MIIAVLGLITVPYDSSGFFQSVAEWVNVDGCIALVFRVFKTAFVIWIGSDI
ncbi:MAG: hypothetical protein OXC62_02965 [Aestuariivita sp.]|nr:hypothetical protein [Aestuariivita sp.]